MKQYNFFIYITTNQGKTVLYTGITNDLEQRLIEHYFNRGKSESFAGKYHCYCLVYYERFQYIQHVIQREKQIKGWLRSKKNELIEEENSEWKFLNNEIMDWPPRKDSSLRSE